MILVIVGAFAVLLAGGGFVWWLFDSGDSPSTTVAATPRAPRFPNPSYTPPSYTPPSYDPPSSMPTTPTTTYSPPPQNYGAIAVGHNGALGKAWDYGSASAARQRALNQCPTSGCKVLTTFVNGCGAVAYNSSTRKYWGGHGDTRSEAQSNAISNAGGGRWITWVCTTR